MSAVRTLALRHRDALLLAAGMVLFALAYVQISLYFSNQNQYFLHAFARAGIGQLADDWLANTVDPTPLFTILATLTLRFSSENVFYLYFAILAGIYFASAMSIASLFVPEGPARRSRLIMVGAALIIVHGFLTRYWLFLVTHWDFFWLMNSGVAGQYILGPGLQPSVFGVLLLAAVAAFLHGRRFLAAALIIVGGSFHATYLLPGALLTIGFMVDAAVSRRPREALTLGVVTLIGVVPVLAYVVTHFASSQPDITAAAQQILATDRLPHHALISRWFNLDAYVALAWLTLAWWLAGPRWRLILGIPAALAFGLSLVQYVSGNLALSLLFPWRLSAILVPVATAVLFGCGAARLPVRREVVAGLVLLAIISASGVFVRDQLWDDPYRQAQPLMERVASDLQPGQVFLIPEGLEQFRLATGAPIFVDYKSIPYLDREVVEWHRRMALVRLWADGFKQGGPNVPTSNALAAEGVTHVVLPDDAYVPAGCELLYSVAGYSVYSVPAVSLRP